MFTIGNPLNFPALRDLSHGGVTLTISEAAYAAYDHRWTTAEAEI